MSPPRVVLADGGRISSLTLDSESGGGNVVVSSTDLGISGMGSSILTQSTGTSPGGDIHIDTETLMLTDEAKIATSNSGSGDAGALNIDVGRSLVSDNVTITTEARQGGGGVITIRAATGTIELTDSAITTEAQGAAINQGSNAGDIRITSQQLVMNRSLMKADARGGNGGNLDIDAASIFLADANTCSNESCLTATSERGVSGTIDVRAPISDLSGVVAPLPQIFAAASALLQQRCAARLRGTGVGSFILAGRDRIPSAPNGSLATPLAESSGFAGAVRQARHMGIALVDMHQAASNRAIAAYQYCKR